MRVSASMLLEDAHNGGYAVPMYNTVNLETTRGLVAAAEKLNIPILLGIGYDAIEHMVKEINAAVGRPLVMHGGSGTPAGQVRAAVEAGISKVNIGTNVMRAFVKGLRSVPESVTDIRTVLRSGRDEIYNVVAETSDMFGTLKATY